MKIVSGKTIKKLRESKGYSLRVFSKMIYVSKSSLQRWENSIFPENEELIMKIADVLKVSVEDLYEKTNEENIIKPTEKQLTEMQFGIKGLALILFFLSVFVLIFILLKK